MSLATSDRQKSTGKSISALILFILAVVLTIPATIGQWGHQTLIDENRYIETVGPLASSPEIQEAVSDAVKDAVLDRIDTKANVDKLITGLFPDQPLLQNLSAPIAAGINSGVSSLIDRFVASDRFQELWLNLNIALQRGIVGILQGNESGPIQLEGDNVVLDISTLLTDVQTYLVDQGISVAANVPIPETDRQIVLAEAPVLAQVRTIYSITSPILTFLPALVAALFALSIWLARRRARMIVASGIALLLSGLAITQAVNAGGDAFVNQLAGSVFAPASSILWDTLFAYLLQNGQAIALLGVITIVAGWLAGRTSSARWVRGHLNRGLSDISGRLPDSLSGVLTSAIVPIRWLIMALGVILLLITGNLSTGTVWSVTALVAGLMTVAQLLAARPSDGSAASETVEVVEIES
jgi:hypothetical protein